MGEPSTPPETPTLRRTSAWAGAAGVAVTLGLTELFAGFFTSIPSAISAIGSWVIDRSPGWLKDFAVAAFGTSDKAALAISIVTVALLIGWFVGRSSAGEPPRMLVAFVAAAVAAIAAQLGEAGAAPAAVVLATSVAGALGLATWWGIVAWAHPDVEEPVPFDMGRRRLMVGLAGAAAVSVIAISVGRAKLRTRAEAARSALELPRAAVRAVDPTAAHDFDLQGVQPIVVGGATFYRIDTALVVPAVMVDDWTLTIKGMVDKEVVLTYEDLVAMPLVERYVTLSCVSNEVGGLLVGNALWTGVPLQDLLDMAGVRGGVEQVVGRSVDGFTAGFPIEAVYDGREPLVAIGMNRDVLPASHGFPARLVVPGLYGYVSATKWLTEIELTTWDGFDGYWIPRGWSKEGPVKTQSRIDRPRIGQPIEAGVFTAAGVAWAPTRAITKVEVRMDEGEWREAELSEPLSDDAWVQWKLDIDVPLGRHSLQVRATDGTGQTQGGNEVNPKPNGAEGWHRVNFEGIESATA